MHSRQKQEAVTEKAPDMTEPQLNTKQFRSIEVTEDFFGPLYAMVTDDDITDIDYANGYLWLTYSNGLRKRSEETEGQLTPQFLSQFIERVKLSVSKEFNRMTPVLEAETDTLRLSIFHSSIKPSGTSICIRKTLPYARIDLKEAIESGYITQEAASLVINSVKANMNIIVCGEVGVGKTEFVKLIAQYIPREQRVITIEDNLELHLKEINPESDILELRVNSQFSYDDAIKASLRHNANWLMISEIRGEEANSYITALTTGVNGITTLHTDEARRVPERIVAMCGSAYEDRIRGDISTFLNLAVLIRKKQMPDGTVKRYVDQVVMFDGERDGKPKMIFNDGLLLTTAIPLHPMNKYKRHNIDEPFYCEEVKALMGEDYKTVKTATTKETEYVKVEEREAEDF